MSVISHRTPMSIPLARKDPGFALEIAQKRTTSIELKRRSVSSMKGLLPLALPANCSSPLASPLEMLPTEETVEGNVDYYFPEMLARDLEISSAVFAAKNMTAGTPTMSLWLDDQIEPRATSFSPIYPAVSQSRHDNGTTTLRALGAIKGRDAMVSFIEQQRYATDETRSDVESVTSDEFSPGVEPPSIRVREQSIVTTATSVASTSGHSPSPKDLMAPDRAQEYSWIDVDSDDDADLDTDDEELPVEQKPVALSPRPSTPPCFDSHLASGTSTALSTPCRRSRHPAHHKNRSWSGASTSFSRRKHSINSIEIPLRGSSLARTTQGFESDTEPRLSGAKSQTSFSTRPQNLQPSRVSRLYEDSESEGAADCEKIPIIVDGAVPDLDEKHLMDIDGPTWPRPNTVYIEGSPPSSPLPTVEAWLDQSNSPFPSPLLGEDLVKAVPLPPDIIETLRVSIACFPETMLLSSSLTIETIRTYSKKVRRPSADIWNDPTLMDIPPLKTKRSFWKRVVSHGRESLSSKFHRSHTRHDKHDLGPSNFGAPGLSAPWAPLRHIFSNCSEHLCDALYAHIVAYNYICRVPRGQSLQPKLGQRPSAATFRQTGTEDIPNKAAHLLGLDVPQGLASPSAGRLTTKMSGSMRFNKDHMSPCRSPTAQQDYVTGYIESGLLRCIARLIAAAKAMGEDNTEERMIELENRGVDMIFVKSLCEIVRIAEEA